MLCVFLCVLCILEILDLFVEEGKEWFSDILRPLSQKKNKVQNCLRSGVSGKTKGCVFSVSTFFSSTFPLKVSEHTCLFLYRENVVHSGTSLHVLTQFFPRFNLYPSINTCTLICLQWALHLFSLTHTYHVHFTRKAKGRDLHQKKAEYVLFRVIRL